MRNLICCVVVAALCVPAAAFDGFEHRDVSNAALLVAVRYAEDRAAPTLLIQARECAVTPLQSFGDITVAVDWFQNITKLTKATAWSDVTTREKLSRSVFKAISAHRNTLHFQGRALCSYRALHQSAIALASTPNATAEQRTEALYTEAVALHFLQDFLSAGHFITPREHSHDAVAGSLHDHFGRVGLKVCLEMSHNATLDEPWRSLVAAARDELPAFPSSGLHFVDDDFSSLDGVEEMIIGGDQRLAERPQQKLLVLLLSAKSISEVLEASKGGGEENRLTECFSRRGAMRARPAPAYHDVPAGTPRFPPQGGFMLGKVPNDAAPVTLTYLRESDACIGALPRCSTDLPAAFRYEVDRKDYKGDLFDASGVQITVSGFPHVKRSISIGAVVQGWDPRGSVEVYDEQSQPTKDTYSGWMTPLFSTGALSFTEGSGYRAIGARIEVAWDIARTALGATIMVGPSFYKWQDHRTNRFDVGLRMTYGFQVLNGIVMIERAHEVDESGRFRRRYSITPGVEVTLSNSWWRGLFHLRPTPCCQR